MCITACVSCTCVHVCVHGTCGCVFCVHYLRTHIAVSHPTCIMCIRHNNSNDMCTELLPVKLLIGSDHPLEEEQVKV